MPVLVESTLLQQSCFVTVDHLLFAILGYQESARVHLRPRGFHQTHVVAADDLIRYLSAVFHAMHFLHTENGVGPWGPFDMLNRPNIKIGNDVLIFDLSYGVVVSKLVHREHAEV